MKREGNLQEPVVPPIAQDLLVRGHDALHQGEGGSCALYGLQLVHVHGAQVGGETHDDPISHGFEEG